MKLEHKISLLVFCEISQNIPEHDHLDPKKLAKIGELSLVQIKEKEEQKIKPLVTAFLDYGTKVR